MRSTSPVSTETSITLFLTTVVLLIMEFTAGFPFRPKHNHGQRVRFQQQINLTVTGKHDRTQTGPAEFLICCEAVRESSTAQQQTTDQPESTVPPVPVIPISGQRIKNPPRKHLRTRCVNLHRLSDTATQHIQDIPPRDI